MDKIEAIITELYNNEDISLGAHGTSIIPGSDMPREICENGLMCRYGDIRRTVNLQDRGAIHAHGNISLEGLFNYDFHKHIFGYRNITQKEGKMTKYIPEEIELEQCSFLIAIPKELSTRDDALFTSGEKRFKREFATSLEDLRCMQEMEGRTIDPKYIVGYFRNGDISTMVFNDKFYGFEERPKGDSNFPVISEEKVKKENESIREKNEEKMKKTTQELNQEASLNETKRVGLKEKVLRIFRKVFNKNKEER